MVIRLAGFSRGGSPMSYTVVPFTSGKNPGAARSHAKRNSYGSTGGPNPGFYEALTQRITGVDPTDTPTADEDQVVASVLAAADLTTTCVTVTADGQVTSVTYEAPSTITGANSPASRTLSLVNTGTDDTGTTVLATLAVTSGVNFVADTPKVIPLASSAELRSVGKGDVLKWKSTHVGGTGLADPGGDVRIQFSEP